MVKLKVFLFFYSYEKLIELKPHYYLGWFQKGDILIRLHKYDNAMQWLK